MINQGINLINRNFLILLFFGTILMYSHLNAELELKNKILKLVEYLR